MIEDAEGDGEEADDDGNGREKVVPARVVMDCAMHGGCWALRPPPWRGLCDDFVLCILIAISMNYNITSSYS